MFKICLFVITAVTVGIQAVESQIVGGEDAAHGEFPYHVLLKVNGEYFCSGALITYKHILTAAHCVLSSIERGGVTTAVVGTMNCNSGGQSYRIVKMLYHKEYPQHALIDWMYDIGIFTLETSVVPSNHVGLVQLPSSEPRVGTEAVISAAGCQTFNGPFYPLVQKLAVRIIDHSTCQSMMHFYRIYPTYICTFVGVGKGVCHGDSGAPLVQNGVIIGILSGGLPCARGYPDIFTDVFKYRSWIDRRLVRLAGK